MSNRPFTALVYDLSLHTGIGYGNRDGAPRIRTEHLPGVGGNAKDGFDLGATFSALYRLQDDLTRVVGPDLIAFESPLMPRTGLMATEMVVRLLFGLASITEMVADLHGIPCEERNVSTVKKFWTGDSRADKFAMIKRCRTLGWDPEDDNSADAAALWSLIMTESDPLFNYRTDPLFARRSA